MRGVCGVRNFRHAGETEGRGRKVATGLPQIDLRKKILMLFIE
jgi:hypothetical protein